MASRAGMPGRKARRGRLFCTGAALVALMTTTAAAADADDTAPSSGGIEQAVVTATRRAETLDKVPISVSAFTEEQIEDLNVKSFAVLARYTPGVKFDQS